ncbi:glycerate kinase [Phlyctema vagabunda]|uniref:Glycerate kinase n=1 Tax=Phlyctema vagabunda TaxID=108571 RepID=A0ABR4P1I7_9HELO
MQPLNDAKDELKILIAPSGFKESLSPESAADCIEDGILRVLPQATIKKMPLVDGGEGFAKALVASTSGELKYLTVTGPIGEPINSHYGILGECSIPTAVVEMAAAAGLGLVPKDMRDPGLTTTYGVGELIVAALEEGVERIIIGCGDSGTSDGGAGALQALGVRLLDIDGIELPRAGGGYDLAQLDSVDMSGTHAGLKKTQIDVACNWHNVLCGARGVARVFGPQKGATPEQVERLAAAFDKYAGVMHDVLERDISHAPGGGASGGLGAGLMLAGATLSSRYELIMSYFDLDTFIDACQLVITAEGSLDDQTPHGKIPAHVAALAKKRGLPIIALAGTIGPRAQVNYEAGIDAYTSILQRPVSLEGAICDSERLLRDAAENMIRMVLVGRQLSRAGPGVKPDAIASQVADKPRQSFCLTRSRPRIRASVLLRPFHLVAGYFV